MYVLNILLMYSINIADSAFALSESIMIFLFTFGLEVGCEFEVGPYTIAKGLSDIKWIPEQSCQNSGIFDISQC